MKIFTCQQCSQTILFDNTLCESCGSSLGFLSEPMTLSALKPDGSGFRALADTNMPAKKWYYCKNAQYFVCNWLVDNPDTLCEACQLNRHIPNLERVKQRDEWQKLEFAKHRLVYSLIKLGLPVLNKTENPEEGLSFDFISEENAVPVNAQSTTGHALGQVTINTSEANSAEREQMREDMKESYRTLIGHFRHEVGHYYWDQLIAENDIELANYRALFGDERASYADALRKHYDNPVQNWQDNFVSAYASSHPWEDWAETWAHYLHIVDTLETASEFGISMSPPNNQHQGLAATINIDPYCHANFEDIIAQYLPLTFAVNNLNRSMGQPDLYPFVLVPKVREKLAFIHRIVHGN
ncbi:zinc-binding metallopeptidase family protein [Marinomonas spartinae]|uniref:zinc-binding metallopeptidase family protein n=1 Tax=Marinomonas spartinae TaxID=1792290 RepID=UPI0018F18237|nr:putative zinc-binding metallopeptidase [Marinomonas spartinae]MBJ7556219.1 putative zinc-binding peptidase [Marinomonas spartinae]